MNLKIIKIFIFMCTVLIVSATNLKAEWDENKWKLKCNKEQKNCQIGILNKVKSDDGGVLTLATTYLQIGVRSEKKMDLISKDEQTYKLGEKLTNVPVLFIQLPLDIDLRDKPLLAIDNKQIANLNFLHCNHIDGCKTTLTINDKIVELLKKGENIQVLFKIFGKKNNFMIKIPLKGFTKSYKKIVNQ